MRKSARLLFSLLAAVALSGSVTGCYVHDRGHAHDRYGRAYRHARWHGEDVYQREDGRWYAYHGGEWVLVPEAEIEIEIH